MSLFGHLAAGAAQGSGYGVAQVGKQTMEAQLAEERAKADYNRMMLLDQMRGKRDDARFDKQMEVQTQWRAEDRDLRHQEFQERRADRQEARADRAADRQEARQWRVEDRDFAAGESRANRAAAAADRAAMRADNKAYRESMIDLRERELGLKGENKLPPLVASQYKGYESTLDDLRAQENYIRKSLATSPDVGMNPEMEKRAKAELNSIQQQMNATKLQQNRLLYDNGAIKAADIVGGVANQFTSLPEAEKWLSDSSRGYGERFATEAREELVRRGVLDKLSKVTDPASKPTGEALLPSPAQKGIMPRREDTRPGFKNDIELTPREMEMQRDYDSRRSGSVSRPIMPGIDVNTASLDELQSAIDSGRLTGRQLAQARARLRGQ